MPRLVLPAYTVVRDTREHERRGWWFDAHPPDYRPPLCAGTVEGTLATGDYTMRRYEHLFGIERKQDLSELWGNYAERDRFEREMERMTALKYRYIIIETTLTNDSFALSPPQFRTGVPGKALIAWLTSISLRYGVHIIWAGACGKRVAAQLMTEVVRAERDLWVPQTARSKGDETA